MHRQIGAVCGALEIAVLLGARLARLLTQEVEVGTLLCGEQLREASEGRLARLPCEPDERSAIVDRALPAGERERAGQLLAERSWAVAGGYGRTMTSGAATATSTL
jgi:hypothetical protein